MVSVLVTTHGDLAAGLLHSAKMLVGEFENVHYISFEEEMGIEQLEEKIEEKLNCVNENNQWLILCDIMGGSPFNVASKFSYENSNISVFYGVNLPLLIEGIMNRENKNLKEVVEYLEGINKTTIGLSPI